MRSAKEHPQPVNDYYLATELAARRIVGPFDVHEFLTDKSANSG